MGKATQTMSVAAMGDANHAAVVGGISVLILTLNEEANLPTCLRSVSWSDDIVVYDSLSTDATVTIAKTAGARVIQRPFDNYASQRNHAIRDVPFKHPWIYMMDADEQVPADLRDEMLQAVADAPLDLTVFRLRRKDMFMGRWLRRSSGYPTWASRLFRKDRVWVERDINEELHSDGRCAYLQGHFIHHPFNRGLAHWVHRHNQYSTMEAGRLLAERQQALTWRDAVCVDPAIRRKTLKQIAFRVPCRPAFMFAYLYLFRLGFLDGLPGLHYGLLRAFYEYLIDLKVQELRRRASGLPV